MRKVCLSVNLMNRETTIYGVNLKKKKNKRLENLCADLMPSLLLYMYLDYCSPLCLLTQSIFRTSKVSSFILSERYLEKMLTEKCMKLKFCSDYPL